MPQHNVVKLEKLIADIVLVSEELNKTPTIEEYTKYGNHSSGLVYKHFDSWADARKAAGLDTQKLGVVSKEQIIEDIRSVADEIQTEPTRDDYEKHGRYGTSTIANKFGSWVAAKKAAGVYSNSYTQGRPASDEDLLGDVRHVAQRLDKEPSYDQYSEYGTYDPETVRKRFGGWKTAKKQAGVWSGGLGVHRDINREKVIDDIQSVYDELGREPKTDEYKELGCYSIGTVENFFGSWIEAKQAADAFDGEYHPASVTKADCIEDLQRLTDDLGRPPTASEYGTLGHFSGETLRNHFGGIVSAREEAGIGSGYMYNDFTDVEMLTELKEVADALGREPSRSEFTKKAKMSGGCVVERFGSWTQAKILAGVYTGENDSVKITEEEIISDLQHVDKLVERPVAQSVYEEHGKYTPVTILKKFGSLISAREAAGIAEGPLHRTGPDHPNWVEENAKSLQYPSALFRENKRKAFERDDHSCQHPGCGIGHEEARERYGSRLHPHHISREHWPQNPEKHHELENIITLCNRHHGVWEQLGYTRENIEKHV